MGNGVIYYGKDKEDFASQAFLMPKAKVTGKVVIAGKEVTLDGSGFVSKNLANISPHKVAKTIHHCKFVTPELTLALCKIQTPKACDHVNYTWGFLVDGGKTVAVSTNVDGSSSMPIFLFSFLLFLFVAFLFFLFPFSFFFSWSSLLFFVAVWLQDGVVDPETKYTIPTKVHFKWTGQAGDGRPFTAEVVAEVKKENLLCRFDVLGHIPSVFKYVD